MNARVSIGIVQPGKTDEGIRIMRDSILPAAKKQKGFNNLLYLTNRSTNKVIVIVQWNTEADMTAGESSGYYQEQVAKMMPLLVEKPAMEHYEVSVQG
jgi:heme-degrading monooxygenase HmoA